MRGAGPFFVDERQIHPGVILSEGVGDGAAEQEGPVQT